MFDSWSVPRCIVMFPSLALLQVSMSYRYIFTFVTITETLATQLRAKKGCKLETKANIDFSGQIQIHVPIVGASLGFRVINSVMLKISNVVQTTDAQMNTRSTVNCTTRQPVHKYKFLIQNITKFYSTELVHYVGKVKNLKSNYKNMS